jgi:epoxyqueuosine reductase QueG
MNAHSKGAVTKAYEMVFDALDRSAYEVSLFIERLGGQAVPVPADAPYSSWDADKQHGQGDLSHRHAAVLAGMGSSGKNALLLTPGFGNCVNLASILTNLSLEPDPLFEGDLCISDCNRCIETCPGEAIKPDGTVDQKACRTFHSIVTPRGFKLFSCWECRRVCPVKGTMIRKA